MLDLSQSEVRRGWRTVIYGIVTLSLIGLVWHIAELVKTNVAALLNIADWSLLITTIAIIGYIAENGIREFKASSGGSSLEVDTGEVK